MARELAIGIDLGTTYCCVAVVNHGAAQVIANREGYRTTLSKVYLADPQVQVGKNAEVYSPGYVFSNEIYDLKRLIGCMYDDPVIQDAAKRWPFQIRRGVNGEVLVCFKKNDATCQTLPESLCAIILCYLRIIASEYLDQDVRKAVITVPTYFNTSQRQATRESAKIAGFEVLSLINEASAAALAYVFDRYSNRNGNILIYDLGGGTFDVSIISVNDRKMEVKAVSGDTHLGGTDFLDELVKYVVDELKQRHGIITLSERSLRRIRGKCQDVMTNLSSLSTSFVDLEYIEGKEDVNIEIQRQLFEDINMSNFNKTMDIVKDCMKSAGFNKYGINEVLLIGGCTRIPRIQKMLEEYFGESKVKKTTNPDEAVAIGAAYQAAYLNKQDGVTFSLTEVLPLSIGMKVKNTMHVMIPRNSPLPVSIELIKSVRISNNQVSLDFYEGESKDPEQNVFLGAIRIPTPKDTTSSFRLTISMSVTKDEDIDIKVTEHSSGKCNTKKLTLAASRIKENDIDDMNYILGYMDI